MKNALLCLAFVFVLSAVAMRTEFYSDMAEEEYQKLLEIASYLQRQLEEVSVPMKINGEKIGGLTPFDYSLDEPSPVNGNDASTVFAVGPSDPRYYHGFKIPFTPEGRKNRQKGSREEVNLFGETRSTTEGVRREVAGELSAGPDVRQVPLAEANDGVNKADIYFTAIVAGCSAAAVACIIVIGISCYRLQKNAKAAANVEYPAYGVTGPNKEISPTSGDRRLAQSAQMYHYQHQKQQILAMEGMNNKERRGSISDAESEDDNEEGDYTVYECPGLAPTGEMEVKNPLFHDDSAAVNCSKDAEVAEEPNQPQDLPNFISFD